MQNECKLHMYGTFAHNQFIIICTPSSCTFIFKKIKEMKASLVGYV